MAGDSEQPVILKKANKGRLATAIGVFLAVLLVSTLVYKHVALTATRRAAHEDDIREAIFRYEMKDRDGIIFLDIDRQDPSDSFMRRFSDFKPPVKKLSAIAPPKKPAERWIYDLESGKPGVALWVGKFAWTSDQEVIVDGGYFCGSLCAARGDFYVVFKGGRWFVEKFDIKVIS